MAKTFLPDVNLWLALAFESHAHHELAKGWFDGLKSADACAFCRMTQQGFLRLATNPKAFREQAVTLEQAWQMYDSLLSDAVIRFVDEPPGVEDRWREFTSRSSFSPKLWNDAYLAAFAVQMGGALVTFDRSVSQYAQDACLILA